LIFGAASEVSTPALRFGLLAVFSIMLMNLIRKLIQAILIIKIGNKLDTLN
jgi:hypothetical protein